MCGKEKQVRKRKEHTRKKARKSKRRAANKESAVYSRETGIEDRTSRLKNFASVRAIPLFGCVYSFFYRTVVVSL